MNEAVKTANSGDLELEFLNQNYFVIWLGLPESSLHFVSLRSGQASRPIKSKLFCDLAGARTQDPLLKREMLYQLSYQIGSICQNLLCDLAGASRIFTPLRFVAFGKGFSPNQIKIYFVIWLGLEPRTLSLKGRCSTN